MAINVQNQIFSKLCSNGEIHYIETELCFASQPPKQNEKEVVDMEDVHNLGMQIQQLRLDFIADASTITPDVFFDYSEEVSYA